MVAKIISKLFLNVFVNSVLDTKSKCSRQLGYEIGDLFMIFESSWFGYDHRIPVTKKRDV